MNQVVAPQEGERRALGNGSRADGTQWITRLVGKHGSPALPSCLEPGSRHQQRGARLSHGVARLRLTGHPCPPAPPPHALFSQHYELLGFRRHGRTQVA